MEATAVKRFFNQLSAALSSKNPGSFVFSEGIVEEEFSRIQLKPDAKPHDISYLVYRLKKNALGRPDHIDKKIRNTPEALIEFACDLLEARWNTIKDTPEDYTCCSTEINQPALTFARELVKFSWDALQCEPDLKTFVTQKMRYFSVDNKPKKSNIYALLIPTLTQIREPIHDDLIINFDLNSFIVSEDGASLYLLENSCINFQNGKGFLKLDGLSSEKVWQFFTPLEKTRIEKKLPELQFSDKTKTLYADCILTQAYPTPTLKPATKNKILDMLQQAKAVEFDHALSFEGLKQVYATDKTPLTPQYTKCLWDAHAAQYRDDDRRKCALRDAKVRDEVQEDRDRDAALGCLEASFRADLEKFGAATLGDILGLLAARNEIKAKSPDAALVFLAETAQEAELSIIAAKMQGYFKALEQDDAHEYQCLMNQVYCEPLKQPKTLYSLWEHVPDGTDCVEVTLLSGLKNFFKFPEPPEAQPVSASASIASGRHGFYHYLFSSSSERFEPIGDSMARSWP